MYLEDALTPKQIDPSMVQEGSGSAATTHSRIEEDFVENTIAGEYYLLSNDKQCFIAKLCHTNPGVLVHNIPLKYIQVKYLIALCWVPAGKVWEVADRLSNGLLHDKLDH